jgi:hypothetical protein
MKHVRSRKKLEAGSGLFKGIRRIFLKCGACGLAVVFVIMLRVQPVAVKQTMAIIKNTVVVAIMQVGIIVAGMLAAAICHKVFTSNNMAMPLPAAMLYSYGLIGFFIPVVWGPVAVVLQLRTTVSDGIKSLLFWLGVLMLIMMTVFIVYADVTPWFHGFIWHLTGDDNGGD